MPMEVESSSFRDLSGFLFRREGKLYRQINQRYKADFDLLMDSGLYEDLRGRSWLVSHREVDENQSDPLCYKTIQPDPIPFISYPYEWCFSQLKDAALRTLDIQLKALEYGMSLKDASAFNIQFKNGKPILIDTLSFEAYHEGAPWVAYRQFCQHFLGPLALMSFRDSRLHHLWQSYIDGLPLDLVASLLPRRAWLNGGLLLHLGMQGQAQKHFASGDSELMTERIKRRRMSKSALVAFIEGLRSTVESLQSPMKKGFWVDYQKLHNYADKSNFAKQEVVGSMLQRLAPKTVWDVGANTGAYSRLAARYCDVVVSIDMDHDCVEANYKNEPLEPAGTILPLICDLTAPTAALGWNNRERLSLVERASAEVVLALALVHHLAIGNNVPLNSIAQFFAGLGPVLIIEFIPKSDSQVARMLSLREDIFDNYTKDAFERAFSGFFKIEQRVDIEESERTLYLMTRLPEAHDATH